MAANAGYLLNDVSVGRGTPFEALQSTIDININHAAGVANQMEFSDLLNIYEQHAVTGNIESFLGHRGTPEWERSMSILSACRL